MSSIAKLNIILDLEAANFEKGMSKSEHQAQQFSRKFQVDMDKATKSAKQFAQRTTEYLENIENAAKNINKNSNFQFFTTLGGYAQAASGNIIKYADSYTELGNRIRLVTKSNDEFVKANAAVFDISLRTNQAISSTSQIYQRFAQNADTLKISQQKISELTETVSKAVAISGASNAASEASLTQFGQALASGILRGQEFNSVVEQTPALAKALADGLGVTIAELRKMANDGKLTTDVLVKGLENAKKSVDHQFSSRIITIGQAFTNLETNITKFVGEMDQAIGASQTSISVLNALAKNVDVLGIGVAALATSWGLYHTQGFLKSRAAIYEQNKALKAQKVAQATALVTQREKIATLAQETAVRLENTMQSYNANKATMEEIAVTQQRIATEKAKIAVEMQGVSSRAERIALSTQLKALEQQEIQLAQQKIAVDKQQIATKQALKVAYAENAITQSRLTASTVASTTATTVYGRAVAGVKNELNLMKAAALSNPLMTLAMLATTAGSAIWMLSENKKMAREEALRYADSIDQVRTNLEQMTKVQVEAELVKVKRSLQEQEAHLESLKQKQRELQESTQQTVEYIGQEWGGAAVAHKRSTEEIEKAQEELKLTTAEVEKAQNQLNKTLEIQRDLQAHIPVSELKDRFAELFPNIEHSQIKVDGLNVSIGNFSMQIPAATADALKFAGAVGEVTKSAIQAAIAIANLPIVKGGEVIDPKNLKMIEQLERRNAIAQAKGKDKIALQVKDALLNSGMKEGEAGYQRLKEAYEQQFAQQASSGGKTRSGADYRKDFESYFDDLKKTNADTLKNIDVSRANSLEKLNKLIKAGVVSHEEAEEAKTLITQRYLQEREELAERYAPHLSAKNKMQRELYDIQQLQSVGALSNIDARNASDRAKFEYAQTAGRNAVSVQDQVKGIYDPLQDIANQQAQELAQLDAFHQTQLLKEEEFQKLKQQIIERYANDKFQTEMQKYADGLNTLGSAFGDLTSVIEQAGGKQSAAYKAMFAIQKSFAIAEATINVTRAASQAMADWSKMDAASKFAAVAGVMSQGMALVGQIRSVGFSSGGYTGDGGKYTPAGIVHKGEYVITKEATARLGLDYLNYLNYGKRGFASGGGVGVPRVPSTPTHFGGSQNVTVTVINNGKPTSAEVETKKDGQDLAIAVKLMEQIADGVYRRNQTRDLRSGGALNR
ncbi:tape measure protein [Glaesserella parasuis]|uniref:tape measure protein n=1 Tax=Glaesserella parasuis TaxID=738 RepID=UPI00094F64DA|nr:tape measure protein [Glaesserella parasuis]MDG6772296.1 tape measure protein [Glaesserella parasuis]MDO9872621.1 tape measure protein [Glaesserella parasuis]MDO9914201.1 tape measure protein [Glaesserella parasuis]MDP0351507.1 tape measure protein [Glaesserella parasuis]MWQ32844.1 tape measure protein [Glaesserella parasuis]